MHKRGRGPNWRDSEYRSQSVHFFAGTCWERSGFGKSNIKTVIIFVRTPSVRRPKSPSRQILLHGQRIYRNPLLHPSWWIWWEGLLSFFLYLSVLDSPSRVLLSRNPNFICTFWSHSNCSGYGILCVSSRSSKYRLPSRCHSLFASRFPTLRPLPSSSFPPNHRKKVKDLANPLFFSLRLIFPTSPKERIRHSSPPPPPPPPSTPT